MQSVVPTFGILTNTTSYNLGDRLQALAASQYLPTPEWQIERASNEIKASSSDAKANKVTVDAKPAIKVLYNGRVESTSLPPAQVVPFFRGCSFEAKAPLSEPYLAYLRQHEPIGCRDERSVLYLTEQGVNAYFSGDLLLTLQKSFLPRGEDILVVDAHVTANSVFNAIVPRLYRRKVSYLTQALIKETSEEEAARLTKELLTRLETARLVFTSSYETAMICLAFATPVIYLTEDRNEAWLKSYHPYLKIYGPGEKADHPFEGYTNPFPSKLRQVQERLREEVRAWVGRAKDIKVGRSIFTACMNRNSHLEQALPSWLATGADEIVIVDWGSTLPVKKLVDRYNSDARIKLITVTNVTRWVLTWAFNLAAQATNYSTIFKVDCDTVVNEDFFAQHPLTPSPVFYAGEWSVARNPNEMYNNGLLYVERELFFQAGGYPENITTYGYDDCSIKKRLEKIATRRVLNCDYVTHLEHKDEARAANQQLAYADRLDIEIERNRLIDELNLWNGYYSRFSMEQLSPTEYTARHLYSVSLDPLLREQLFEKAVANRNYVRGQNLALKPPPAKKLVLKTEHGPGNRLRALASALVVARESGRELVLIWQPDLHCEARFEDLYQLTGPLQGLQVLDSAQKMEEKGWVCYDYLKQPDLIVDTTVEADIYVIASCVLRSELTNWDKESALLRRFELLPSIQERVANYEHKYALSTTIGVHIRMGQAVSAAPYEDTSTYTEAARLEMEKWRSNSHYDVFIREMKRILRTSKHQKFFVCCDNSYAYTAIREALPHNIITLEQESFGRDVKAIQEAMAHAQALASTESCLVSGWSSYSELIARLSGKKVRQAGVDF